VRPHFGPGEGPSVGLIGYGRFGRAFAALLVEEGIAVRAFDPASEVPAGLRAPDLAALVAEADMIGVAVPVPAMPAVLRQLRPLLRPGQIVFDVGSVKVHPVEAMRDILGESVPWAASHPLFGPVSLSLAERPLRVVLCPNPAHPEAVERLRELYERIGCLVIEQEPEAHDRVMASTHALTFFIAKGLLDAGVSGDVPFTPPSFQAIARTIASVREDAGHLFKAIQLENPYAAEEREKLLATLSAIHAALEHPESLPAGERGRAALSIPATSAPPAELRETRDLIDAVDRKIVKLIVQRSELAKRAGHAKAQAGQKVHDPGREAALFDERRRWAAEAGVEEETVETVFRSLVSLSRRIQGEPG
jgi:prephenate dehydrogenase